MNWEPQEKPGYTLYHAQTGTRLYVIQKKNSVGIWRLFVSNNDSTLRTIFVGDSMTECSDYAEQYEARQ